MKMLLTSAAFLAALFGLTFVLISATGAITAERIEDGMAAAALMDPLYVAMFVVALLFLDLFLAVPTLTISILSGYFLGPVMGTMSAAAGMLMAGSTGYVISRFAGPALLNWIYRDASKLQEMQEIFAVHSTALLLLSRAMPILPEVCCCLAGATRMPAPRFLVSYAAATIPYATIAAYAGSQSSLADPKPAILAAIAIAISLWLACFCFFRMPSVKALRNRQGRSPGL